MTNFYRCQIWPCLREDSVFQLELALQCVLQNSPEPSSQAPGGQLDGALSASQHVPAKCVSFTRGLLFLKISSAKLTFFTRALPPWEARGNRKTRSALCRFEKKTACEQRPLQRSPLKQAATQKTIWFHSCSQQGSWNSGLWPDLSRFLLPTIILPSPHPWPACFIQAFRHQLSA